ncbi:MAG: N-acetyltransferase family protein, partial [Bdellovibrionota bacterium]
FRREGYLRGAFRVKERYVDDYLYAMLAKDWSSSLSSAPTVSGSIGEIEIRRGTFDDFSRARDLYQETARIPGGLARQESEITDDYLSGWIQKSLEHGIWLVAEEQSRHRFLGSIHAYRPAPQVFSHVLSDLTIAVHPSSQGRGIGRKLFSACLETVRHSLPEILRVELIARESNHKAIRLYQSLGFSIEGRLENRIHGGGGRREADIPMAWQR